MIEKTSKKVGKFFRFFVDKMLKTCLGKKYLLGFSSGNENFFDFFCFDISWGGTISYFSMLLLVALLLFKSECQKGV